MADTNDIHEKTMPENHGSHEEAQKGQVDPYPQDAFGNEEHAEVRYKVLTWWYAVINESYQQHPLKHTLVTDISGNVPSSWWPRPSP